MAGIFWRRLVFAMALICGNSVSQAPAQLLTDFIWNQGLVGNQDWQINGNWNMPGFPDDPGRIDLDPMVIDPVIGANVSVALASNLNLNVGATNVTVASLTMGGTSGPVTTNLTSSGGVLVFENYESNNTSVTPTECAFNCGDALLTSQGVAGAVNTITAPVRANNERIEVIGTRDVTLAGGLQVSGNLSSIVSALPNGTKVVVTGNVNLVDAIDGMTTRSLTINDDPRSPEGMPSVATLGTIEFTGTISGPGGLVIGPTSNSQPLPLGTVILHDNSYTGRTTNNRSNIVLAHDNAFGIDTALGDPGSGGANVKQGNPSQGLGYNFISTDDARTIAVDMQMAQWQSVKGDHSLTWTGAVSQTNSRGWVNLLPSGKTLTLTGAHYAVSGSDFERTMTFDGTGKTVVTGGLFDHLSGAAFGFGTFSKQGTGVLVISGGNSFYQGDTYVDGGNLHFATNADVSGFEMISTGGAVGVDTGTLSSSNLLGRLGLDDYGGLMLAPSEAGATLDFTSTLSQLANMSVAAPETGLTFTGTITPANNTYRLGGGSGTLTLPNANQLTGARNLVVINGGEVVLAGSHNYSGTTTVMAQYHTSKQDQAAADSRVLASDQLYLGTTLTIPGLNSLGTSSDAAGNLFIQGSTLRYTGAGATTNRLFTIGTAGATLDASGTGAITFGNTGAVAMDPAEARVGDMDDLNGPPDIIFNLANTDDLLIGMPITGGQLPADTVIAEVLDQSSVRVSNGIPPNATVIGAAYTFGTFARTLTLTGSNLGNNTLASLIADSPVQGAVGMTKTGAGKWILSGNNTYTGPTHVMEGTLLVNGTQTGGGAYTVDESATLGGSGTLGGPLTASGAVAPGQSAGTLTVSGDATLESTATLEIELGGLLKGTEYDVLNVIGSLTANNATLAVSLLPGFSPSAGNSFDVLDFSSAGGSLLFDLPAGNWDTSQVLVNGTLVFLGGGGVTGDFNNDGNWNCTDINLLSAAIASGSMDLSFDMNGDGVITRADITDAGVGWLAVGGANNPAQTGGNAFVDGDANLSGGVDGSDFGIWNTNKFSAQSAYCLGDFNASGSVDGSDFGIWNTHKFQSSDATAAVPEPAMLAWLMGLAVTALIRRRAT